MLAYFIAATAPTSCARAGNMHNPERGLRAFRCGMQVAAGSVRVTSERLDSLTTTLSTSMPMSADGNASAGHMTACLVALVALVAGIVSVVMLMSATAVLYCCATGQRQRLPHGFLCREVILRAPAACINISAAA